VTTGERDKLRAEAQNPTNDLGKIIRINPDGTVPADNPRLPGWQGNAFVAGLAGQHIERLVFDGDDVVTAEKLLTDLGKRIRDIRHGPDGALWVLTDEADGEVLRISPAD
jgi:aldose sugar dehydrogenase